MTLEEPDKGHAWVVLFGACVINMILSGISRMIGLLYVAIIDYYEVTRKEASLPFTVRNAVRYMAGPLAGVLGQTYGIRTVTFWGGLIAAAGSILCSFAPSVGWIVFYWGILHGLGFALANTLFQVIINQYFEKHRASASGICLSGACIGSLIFPVMIETMLSEYGVFGCFLLLGGLFLNVLPPSLVLQVPPWVEFPEAYARKRELLLKQSSSEPDRTESLSIFHLQVPDNIYSGKNQIYKPVSEPLEKIKGPTFKSQDMNCHQSNIICTFYQPLDGEELLRSNNKIKSQNGIPNPAFVPDDAKITNQEKCLTENLPEVKKESTSFFTNVGKIPQLYRNPIYNLISLSIAVYFAVFLPVLTVIVDYTRDKGIPRSCEKYIIHSFTIGDLLGRLSFGWVTDRKILSFPIFMMLTFIAQGIFVSLFPISSSLTINMVFVGLYGVTAGIIFAYIPVLVHKFVDKDSQSIAIGCVGLFSSATTFGLPPLIGYFRDNVGSYDGLFYILAALSMIPAGLWLLVYVCQRIQEKNQKSRTSE